MRFTDYKNSNKINQILPILKEHFGNSVNLVRIKLMSLMIHALCGVLTGSLHKIVLAMPSDVGRDSNMKRLQRSLAGLILNLDMIAKMIFSLLPVKTGLVLGVDRTNWKLGTFNINILMPGIT